MVKSKRKFKLQLFLRVNQFFVVLLLLTYISPYVQPQFFWPLSVFGLSYLLLLLINIIFIIIWLLFLNKNFLYSLLAILLGLGTFNKHFKFKKNIEQSEIQSFKLLSYNVKWLSNSNDKNADIKVRNAIQNYLKEQNTQIICLQEFQTYPSKGVNTVKEFQERLKMPWYAESRYLNKSKFKFIDLMLIYSKYPIIKQQELRHQEKCYALIVDIVYKKDTLRLFNVHLESNHFARDEYEIFSNPDASFNENTRNSIAVLFKKLARYSKTRSVQVNQINELIKNSPHPVLVCGDFNDTPGTYTYRKMAKNLKDAFIEKGKGYGNTFNGKLPAMRIDYILSDTIFQIHQFEIGKFDKSDHFPIISTLSLRPQK